MTLFETSFSACTTCDKRGDLTVDKGSAIASLGDMAEKSAIVCYGGATTIFFIEELRRFSHLINGSEPASHMSLLSMRLDLLGFVRRDA
jgi:hypothetical protein